MKRNSDANDHFATDLESEDSSLWLDRLKLVALIAIALAGAFGLGIWFQAHSTTPLPSGPFPSQTPAPVKSMMVQVSGEVAHPGLYSMLPHSRVGDAIEQAGGPSAQGDTASLNLAAWVEDGTRIEVPAKGAHPRDTSQGATGAAAVPPDETPAANEGDNSLAPPATKTGTRPSRVAGRKSRGANSKKPTPEYLSAHPVDINAATAEELQKLPGVGPAMADKIIAWRQANGRFKTPDDLRGVKGIGPKKFEKLRPLVTTG